MGFLDTAFTKLAEGAETALEEIQKKRAKPKDSNKKESKPEKPPAAISFYLSQPIASNGGLSVTSLTSLTMAEVLHYGSNATRWEKTVVATDSIVNAVGRFDPDGIDIVCVGGAGKSLEESFEAPNDAIEWHTNIIDSMGIEEKITARVPGGPCSLGKAMLQVLTKAMEKDLSERPCSVLVLTAGKPDDSELLEDTLKKTSQAVADKGGIEKCPLSITFIQIGKDEDAEAYLKYLDKQMVGFSDETGKKVDIVDTMGFQELKNTVDKIDKDAEEQNATQKKNGVVATAIGAVAGAAIGAGGMYLKNQQKAKKRVQSGSWGGTWKCTYDGYEISTLTVTDDSKGNLLIEGLEEPLKGTYKHAANGDAEDDDFYIQITEPSGGDVVTGTPAGKAIVWSDGTQWESLSGWAGYLGAATAGAATAGMAGYAIQKSFFTKIIAEEDCDYFLVLDRSYKMGHVD